MADIAGDVELGEVALIGVAAIVLVYMVKGGLSSLGSGLSALWSKTSAAVSNAAAATVTAVQGTPSTDNSIVGDSGLTVGYLKSIGYTEAEISQLQAQAATNWMASTVPGDYTGGGVPSPF